MCDRWSTFLNVPRRTYWQAHTSDGTRLEGTAVPADQFGEQTYIKRGKGSGGMKCISTNPEQVAVWVNSFSLCAHLDIAMEHMYNEAGDELKATQLSRWGGEE